MQVVSLRGSNLNEVTDARGGKSLDLVSGYISEDVSG
ncbi:hypothetical protein NC652_041789 [Populus alba x Populus x berolinensis]|nr:hypothetical protein NC652_041789 [Populus alba x Populus x berolinensis]